MNILWVSNYSSHSGYANQARLFVPRLKQVGHKIAVFEIASSQGVPHEIGGIQVIPTHLDPLGGDILLDHVRHLHADIVITLIDAWAMRNHVMDECNWFPLVPIDHMPIPPAVATALKSARLPIAISQFGQQQLKNAGFDSYYVPHGVDPTVWYPQDKRQAKQNIGVKPDAFMASFVGVNDSIPSRKGIPELLTAWSIFSQAHPDAGLYMHTSQQGNLPQSATGGVRIDLLLETFGINPDTVKFVDQYRYKTGMPARELAYIASASDVLVLPTRGEGFGLPLIEFQRCGCPVITTDFGAGAELCASGWLVEYEPDWGWQSAIAAKPSVTSLVERLEEAYGERNNPARRKEAEHFASQYDIDKVMSRYMIPTIRSIGEVLLDRSVVNV